MTDAEKSIGLFSDVDSFGGSEVYLASLIDGLVELGFEPRFFYKTAYPIKELLARLKENVKVECIERATTAKANTPTVTHRSSIIKKHILMLLPKSLKVVLGTRKEAKKLSKLLRNYEFGIFHVNEANPTPDVWPIAARLAGIPRVFLTLSLSPGFESGIGKLAQKTIAKSVFDACDKVITKSEFVKEEWLSLVGYEYSGRLVVVPNGIDLGEVRPSSSSTSMVERRRLGYRETDVLVGIIGRLIKLKGQHYLLEAISRLNGQTSKSVKVLVVGEGGELGALKVLANHLELTPLVSFVGFVSDVGPYYDMVDIVAVPSEAESFGWVAIEAMARSKPVVASRVGGLQNVVIDGESGLLVPPGDVKSLSESLLELIDRPATRRRLGKSGRKRVNELYSKRSMLNRTVRLYQDAESK